MRIRSTKPEFWRSERIASVSWEARLVLKGLESFVDDNGVGKDDMALIVGDLFQRDLIREPSRTLARVSEAISELQNAGLVWRYEHKGTPLLFVAFWETAQRVDKPQAGRFPRPDGTMNYRDSSIREPDKNIRESSRGFLPGTGEQGNRGTGEQDDDARANEPPPPEPPDDQIEVVIDPTDVPDQIETPTRQSKPHPSSAAKTVVRQVLGTADYDRRTIERLAVGVGRLASQGKPDALIREALAEWDRRPNAKPEWLESVYGDVVKRSRAQPAQPHKMRALAELAAEERAHEQANRKELA
jgi:hypothetical protein